MGVVVGITTCTVRISSVQVLTGEMGNQIAFIAIYYITSNTVCLKYPMSHNQIVPNLRRSKLAVEIPGYESDSTNSDSCRDRRDAIDVIACQAPSSVQLLLSIKLFLNLPTPNPPTHTPLHTHKKPPSVYLGDQSKQQMQTESPHLVAITMALNLDIAGFGQSMMVGWNQ